MSCVSDVAFGCNKGDAIYEGKGKILYESGRDGVLIAEFKDDLTAFNAQKRGAEDGKGELNCCISSLLFSVLGSKGIKTHFLSQEGKRHMKCSKVNIIPLEVVVRNVSAGSLSKRLGIEDGLDVSDTPLGNPLVELYYKDDGLGDPMVCDSHCIMLNIASQSELDYLRGQAIIVNSILEDVFSKANMRLVDLKLEFGKTSSGEIVLADEISPDSCRLWDTFSGDKMDKDRFRQDLGGLKSSYEEILRRLQSVCG